MKAKLDIYEVDSIPSFVSLKAQSFGGVRGNIAMPAFYFSPQTAIAVGKELIRHAEMCGAEDEKRSGECEVCGDDLSTIYSCERNGVNLCYACSYKTDEAIRQAISARRGTVE